MDFGEILLFLGKCYQFVSEAVTICVFLATTTSREAFAELSYVNIWRDLHPF